MSAIDPMAYINELAPANAQERARQNFVSATRRHIMVDLSRRLGEEYASEALPQWQEEHGEEPTDSRQVRRAMLRRPVFSAFSSLRYNAQEMVWASVQDQIERNWNELNATAKRLSSKRCGSLQLDTSLPIPRDVSAMDVHLMPGCWHQEYSPDDTAQGALFELGSNVFGGGLKFARRGSVAYSMAHYLQELFPEFKPRRILDLGASVGTNTLPYAELFPEAEVFALDVAAPQLRHGHARATAAELPVHFVQQNAEATNFDDGSFDLVVSSYFFHELSVKSTHRVLAESRRLLAPGGLTLHMELPDAGQADPYYNFYLDWDAYYNNEPHYAAFRGQDPRELLRGAGFEANQLLVTRIPNYSASDAKDFAAAVRGEQETPAHGNGASWCLFGAWR
jgi:ubiquinone/menaquinone biosynthesis C-methylase UbiE